jgi:hypothetical protein
MPSKDFEARLQTVEDILAIDRLEKIYGYYLCNREMRQIVDLFSDNAESIEIGDHGVFKGKEGVRRYFLKGPGGENKADQPGLPPGAMGFHMQHQSVVTVAPGNQTAKGRWYLVMIMARPAKEGGPIRSILGHGVYENEFIKEDGVWKFKKVHCSMHYCSPIGEGWTEIANIHEEGSLPGRDADPTFYHPYPNLQILPYHFKNPVTGR